MLKSSFRLFSVVAKSSLFPPSLKNYGLLVNNNLAAFCKTQKHESNEHKPRDQHNHKHKHQREAKEQEAEEAEVQKQQANKHEEHEDDHHSRHHKHGPNCKHDHGHHHETHEHKSDHDHHMHVKLSKLSFEELVELKTEEGLKHAHHIYEKEIKKLREMKQEKEHLMKNIDFYKKVEQDIKEKQEKLAVNIANAEEEIVLSKRRAEKQIEESKSFAVTKIAKELLEVADCIANCKKYAEQSEIKDKYTEEVVRSQQIMKAILKRFEIEEFDPTNQEYDPNLQESLMEVPTPPGYKPNHVAMTMRTGYTIKGRLLRSARVGIFS